MVGLVVLATAVQAETVTLIPQGAAWRYLADGSNQGTTWKASGFSDASWRSGPAQLGYGDGDEATIVSYGPDASNKYVTTYFRHAFSVTEAGWITGLTLQILRDDGAVVYLNGTQVASYSMPSTFNFLTYATTAADYPWDTAISLPPSLLVSGVNVLAVEIHQCNASSSDLSLDLILTAEQLPPGTAPDAPILVAPADASTGIGIPPTLAVGVSDPDDDALTVQYYGRENVAAEPFTLVVLPDTQKYVASSAYAGIFTAQTQWIVDNRALLNIVAVSHEGDVVDTWDDLTQWQRANASLTILDDAGMPYGLLPGNHDIPTQYYNQYFPPTRYAAHPWYGGNYPAGLNDNNFILFGAGGIDFILLQLQYWPGAEVIAWANAVLQAYPTRKAIITTHGFLGLDGARNVHLMGSTQYIWDDLVLPNPNVWFVLCGHVHGEVYRTDMANGHPVHQILADYQTLPEGGEGWLRIMHFVPTDNRVYVETYSPHLDAYQIDADSVFSLDFPMNGFELLGSYSEVGSGQTVSHTWSEALVDTDYQWYATATDATGRTTWSPLWTFSTDLVDTAPPVIIDVAVTEITDRSAVVTWTTDEPADSWVHYGGDPAGSPDLVLSHRVELTGLASSTTYTFAVSSKDAANNAASFSDDLTWFTTLTPNQPPAATPQGVVTLEDSSLDITLSATDDNPASLSFSVVSGPENGSLSGTPPTLRYTPALNFNGGDLFTFAAFDGEFTSTATVTITVEPVNDPPSAPVVVAGADDGLVSLSWTAAVDPDGTAVSYEVWRWSDAQPEWTLVAQGTDLAYSDTGVQNGVRYWYVVRALDLPGDAYTDSVAVSATPSAPDYSAYVIQNPTLVYGTVSGDYTALHPEVSGTQTITEQKVGLSGLLNVEYVLQTAANPGDVALLTLVLEAAFNNWDDAWILELWTPSGWVDLTADILEGAGRCDIADPSSCIDANGILRVRFVDSGGIRKEKLSGIAIETLYGMVQVGSVPNRSPVAGDDAASTTAPLAIDIDVLSNDTDPDGDALTVQSVTTPINGSTALLGDGVIRYLPNEGFLGTETFGYVVADGRGGEATATVTVTVSPAPGETTVHVADIEMSASATGKNYRATAGVTIVTQTGAPASGAAVHGDWLFEGALLQSDATAVTDAVGVAVLTSAPVKTNRGTFTFRVTDVQLGGASYAAELNAETEDSLGVP